MRFDADRYCTLLFALRFGGRAGEYEKKGEESGSVIAMVDLLIRDLENEMTVASANEKTSQAQYEVLMDDAAAKRAKDTKLIAVKERAKVGWVSTRMIVDDILDYLFSGSMLDMGPGLRPFSFGFWLDCSRLTLVINMPYLAVDGHL